MFGLRLTSSVLTPSFTNQLACCRLMRCLCIAAVLLQILVRVLSPKPQKLDSGCEDSSVFAALASASTRAAGGEASANRDRTE